MARENSQGDLAIQPIRVFQHGECEGLGYLTPFLADRDIPYEVIQIGQGEAVPAGIEDVSGLIFLGSAHSVNDRHGWILDELALIRTASQADMPVLGICFGGQLISKSLGGTVTKAPRMQAGWFHVDITKEAVAILGPEAERGFEVFEWHEYMFSLPIGSVPLFYGHCTKNQGFIHGHCLAIQFHPEFTGNKIQHCLSKNTSLSEHSSSCAQSGDEMLEGLNERLDRMHTVADALFSWWLDLTIN